MRMCEKAIKTTSDTVRIVQFSDLHMGEDDTLDFQTLRLMRSIVLTHAPDLVVFTGDLVSGYAIWSEETRMQMWRQALSVVANLGIPFATIYGNHDDQPYKMDPLLWHQYALYILTASLILAGTLTKRRTLLCKTVACVAIVSVIAVFLTTAPSFSIRQSLWQHEKNIHPDLSLSHGSDYCILLQTHTSDIRLFFLDTGGGRIHEGINRAQIQRLKHFSNDIPSVAFLHIPPKQYADSLSLCDEGDALEKPSTLPHEGTDVIQALAELQTLAVFTGHDHGNSWCCQYRAMRLCYGKHSGFGGYDFNDSTRGARIIDLKPNSKDKLNTSIVLWTRKNS